MFITYNKNEHCQIGHGNNLCLTRLACISLDVSNLSDEQVEIRIKSTQIIDIIFNGSIESSD